MLAFLLIASAMASPLNVVFVGGNSGTGKSTVMQALLEDTVFAPHAAKPNVATGPRAAWLKSTPDPRVVLFGRYSSHPLPGSQPSAFGSRLDGADRLQWSNHISFKRQQQITRTKLKRTKGKINSHT